MQQARDGFARRKTPVENLENPGSTRNDVPGKSKSPILVTAYIYVYTSYICTSIRRQAYSSDKSCFALFLRFIPYPSSLSENDPICSRKCHRFVAPSIISLSRAQREYIEDPRSHRAGVYYRLIFPSIYCQNNIRSYFYAIFLQFVI